MTIEQQNLIDSLRIQAADAYDIMDEQQVDYDKFKQVADASLLKADQAQKVYDRLYKVFIYYPFFIKSLATIKDEAKADSDANQSILKSKASNLSFYKLEYYNVINKIKQAILKADVESLAYDMQDIANNPDSLTYSYELVNVAELDADKAARDKAKLELTRDIITGMEVCIDSNGNEIDMNICKPSSTGGGGGGGSNGISNSIKYIPSAEDIIRRKVDDWIKVVGVAVQSTNLQDVINADKAISQNVEIKAEIAAKNKSEEEAAAKEAAADKIIAEKAAADKIISDNIAAEKAAADKIISDKLAAEKAAADKIISDKLAAERADAEKAAAEEAAITSQYSFKVDLSKITADKKLSEQTAPSPRQQNINYALCSSKKRVNTIDKYTKVGSGNYYMAMTFSEVNILPIQANLNLVKGQKIKISSTTNPNIYFLANVFQYNTSNGLLYFSQTYNTGNSGIWQTWDVSTFDGTEEITKYIIDNPYSSYSNGMEWSVYVSNLAITPQEISIARAYCPTSDVSSDYYKSTSVSVGFDGSSTDIKKYNFTPMFVVLGGISIFFILNGIIKNKK